MSICRVVRAAPGGCTERGRIRRGGAVKPHDLQRRHLSPGPVVPGLTVSVLARLSPLADAREFLATQRQGFDPGDTTSATVAQAEQFLQRLGDDRAFLVRLDGQPVGAGAFAAACDRLAEVTGIATLEPCRRRGIASVLTSEAVRTAFLQGVQMS